MQKARVKRVGALLVGISLVAAACGSDDDDGDEAPTTEAASDEAASDEEATDEEAAGEGCTTDGVLTIGTILPVTGDLAFLGPPEVAGAEMAVEDLNAAGGVLGTDVVLEQGDSGDTTTDTANLEVDRLLAAGADAIMGAASSAVSKTVIDKITGSCTIQFSPANTSADFTDYDDNGLYFRTAPSDLLQGRVLGNKILADNATLSILYRQESYGTGLAETIREVFEEGGGIIDEFLPYAVDTESFDAEVDALVEAGSDAIVVVGFAESASILTTMHERGIGPTSDTNVWGVDGNIGIGSELADPSILTGMRATVPSVDLSTIADFTARLDENGAGGEYSYGAETYDSVVIVGLAAAIAGSDDPSAIAAEINGVTKDGEKCTSPADCLALIEAGTDIDYDGFGGPYEFVDAGEPAAASFRIATYDGGSDPNPELDEYEFAE